MNLGDNFSVLRYVLWGPHLLGGQAVMYLCCNPAYYALLMGQVCYAGHF